MEDLEIYMIAKVRLDMLREKPHFYEEVKQDIIREYKNIFDTEADATRAYIASYSFWKMEQEERSKSVDYIY